MFISSAIEHVYGVTMSDKNKTHYTSRLSLHITPAMSDRLDQIALLRDEAKAEIVRAALRAYLDNQEDLLTSRKHFTKMFQRRVDYMERLLVICLWLNVQAMQILYERVKKEPYDLADLLEDAIGAGIATEDGVHGLVERAVQQKTKPPRT
jgi:predicted DNA-binding protein